VPIILIFIHRTGSKNKQIQKIKEKNKKLNTYCSNSSGSICCRFVVIIVRQQATTDGVWALCRVIRRAFVVFLWQTSSCSAVVDSLRPKHKYYFRLFAVNSSGCRGLSAVSRPFVLSRGGLFIFNTPRTV